MLQPPRSLLDFDDPIPPDIAANSTLPEAPSTLAAPTYFDENRDAAWEQFELAASSQAQQIRLAKGYHALLEALNEGRPVGERLRDPSQLPEQASNRHLGPTRHEVILQIWAEIARRRRADPSFLADAGNDHDDYMSRLEARDARRNAELNAIRARATTSGWWGGFFGDLAAGMVKDPVNLATIAIPTGGAGILGRMAYAGAINATVEVGTSPITHGNFERLGIDLTLADHARMTAYAFAGGAAFQGGTIALGSGARAIGNSQPFQRLDLALDDALMRAREGAAAQMFRAMPESVQRRWAEAGTLGDRTLAEALRAARGATDTVDQAMTARAAAEAAGTADTLPQPPRPAMSSDERAAVNVLERIAEIREASPYRASIIGDEAHVTRLKEAMERVIAEHPAPSRAELLGTAGHAGELAQVGRRAVDEGGPVGTPINEGNQPARFTVNGWSVGDGYGATRRRRGGRTGPHQGVDMFAGMGVPFPMAQPYIVVRSYNSGEAGGNTALVRFDDGSEWKAMHLPDYPAAGRYRAGQNVLRSGDSGNADAGSPHIHWQPANDAAHRIYNRGRRAVADFLFGSGGGSRGTGSPARGTARSYQVLDNDGLRAAIGGAESGGANVRNIGGRSSASGLFQFTGRTWRSMHELAFPNYRGARPTEALNASAGEQAAVMNRAADYYREKLRAGGFEPTLGNMYLAHFLGAENAVAALRNPGRAIESFEFGPGSAAANDFIRGMTANQVRLWAHHRIEGKGVREAAQLARANQEPAGAAPGAAPDAPPVPVVRQQAWPDDGLGRDFADFGTRRPDLAADWDASLARLTRDQEGYVPAALSHPELGEVSLVWGAGGRNGYGLARILERGEDAMLEGLPQSLASMRVAQRSGSRALLESEDGQAVARLEWDRREDQWVLAELQRRAARPASADGDQQPAPPARRVMSEQQRERLSRQAQNRALDMPEAGPSLVEWIAARGGMVDVVDNVGRNTRGELASMGADAWHRERPFPPKLLAGTVSRAELEGGAQSGMFGGGGGDRFGRTPDRVFADAIEAGYFPELQGYARSADDLPDIQRLFDAISAELHGRPVYRPDQMEAVERVQAERANAEWEARERQELEEVAEDTGHRLTDDVIGDALYWRARGESPEQSLMLAMDEAMQRDKASLMTRDELDAIEQWRSWTDENAAEAGAFGRADEPRGTGGGDPVAPPAGGASRPDGGAAGEGAPARPQSDGDPAAALAGGRAGIDPAARGLDEGPPEPFDITPHLKSFDDAHGDTARAQVESIEHDLRAAMESEPRTLDDLLREEIDMDAAIKAVKDCM